MNWTDCPIIEQSPGKMSGASVMRGTRLRPQDVVGNADMGVGWILKAFGIAAEDVRTVLNFWTEHYDDLPLEYFSSERIAALGIEDIDWSGCSNVVQSPERLGGEPALRGTPVEMIDLLVARAEGEDALAYVYNLPVQTVHSVLSYYGQHKKHLAPAV